MQGPRFTVAHIGEHIFLLASNGNVVYTAELTLESVVVTNELADDETVAQHGPDSVEAPAGNKLVNYIFSCCRHFPLDDAVSLELANQSQAAGHPQACRAVQIFLTCGVFASLRYLIVLWGFPLSIPIYMCVQR